MEDSAPIADRTDRGPLDREQLSPRAADPVAELDVTSRVSSTTQFIRIAATMTGGVSLAIWMGGVAREVDLLCQASTWRSKLSVGDLNDVTSADTTADPVMAMYLRLLDLLDLAVDTDILSGTSAGGVNAAFLGYALACGKDLSGLRDLWTTLGSLGTLLRDPRDQSVPSLMYGDRQLWSGVYDALQAMPDAPKMAGGSKVQVPADSPDTKLFISTTLLSGETSRFTDSYGTIVQDVDNHGLFTFRTSDLTAADGAIHAALALAARSSASFPGAFEPSYVPYSQSYAATGGLPQRPAMRPFANTTRAHWVVDGGLLANRPIGPLLQAVFDRPVTIGSVRRVLLYIVPSAGASPDILHAQPGDQLDTPLGLAESLLKDVSAVLTQSIGADLRGLQQHNDRVSARNDARVQLAQLATELTDASALLNTQVLNEYVEREAASVSSPIIAAFQRSVSTWPVGGQDGSASRTIPGGWAEFFTQPNSEVRCRQGITTALKGTWKTSLPTTWTDLAAYGRPAYDGAKVIAMAVIRDAQILATDSADRGKLGAASAAVHAALATPARLNIQQYVDDQCQKDGDLRKATPPEVVSRLTLNYLSELVIHGPAANPTAVRSIDPGNDAVREQMTRAWIALADAVISAAPTCRKLVADDPPATPPPDPAGGATPTAPPEATPPTTERRRDAAARRLSVYLDYLLSQPSGGTPTAEISGGLEVALRLFRLHVAQRAILPVSADLEQPVEFIQVSADTRTLLDPSRSTGQSKLTGMQLQHFGAFYKASWRVNDWMWGRLDGAGWLVHMLLDPRRIDVVVPKSPAPPGRAQVFLDCLSAPDLAGEIPDQGFAFSTPGSAAGNARITRDDILAELAYLDDEAVATPTSLPLTSMWVALGVQTRIAQIELPELAHTVLKGPPQVARTATKSNSGRGGPDNVNGVAKPGQEIRKRQNPKASASAALAEASTASPSSVQWANEVQNLHHGQGLQANDCQQYLLNCPVPKETFRSELGSSLLTRTATHAAATGSAALSTVGQIPSVVRPFLTSLRTVTLTGYRATALTDPRPHRLALLGCGAGILGLAAAVQQSTVLGLTGTLLLVVGAYLIAVAAWGVSRALLWAFLAILVLAAAGSLALPWVRQTLFGTGPTNPGVAGRNVYWLGTAWWHPFIALGIFLLAVVLLSVAQDPVGRRRKPRANKAKKMAG